MINPFIEPEDVQRRKKFQARVGNGRVRQHGDGQRRTPTPPRNKPCPCRSGKKAKRCHPDGLKPVVRRVDKGTCEVCGKTDAVVVPLKHEGLPGWKPVVCLDCIRKPSTVKDLLAKQAIILNFTAPLKTDAEGRIAEGIPTIMVSTCPTCSLPLSAPTRTTTSGVEVDLTAAFCRGHATTFQSSSGEQVQDRHDDEENPAQDGGSVEPRVQDQHDGEGDGGEAAADGDAACGTDLDGRHGVASNLEEKNAAVRDATEHAKEMRADSERDIRRSEAHLHLDPDLRVRQFPRVSS